MRYHDLNDLLHCSRSSRAYFLSLPCALQHELHACAASVRTAHELRRAADTLQGLQHLTALGGWSSQN